MCVDLDNIIFIVYVFVIMPSIHFPHTERLPIKSCDIKTKSVKFNRILKIIQKKKLFFVFCYIEEAGPGP